MKSFIHKIKNYSKIIWPIYVITLVMVIAFWPFFRHGKIPVAGDILLGQYYPWLDQKWDNRQTIFPVLNNTIPDSIFSFYPWKYKSIEMVKNGHFPIYDPNTYMGSELFATGTTGLLYPLNFLFLFLDFNLTWGIITASTVFLSASFFYLWLRSKKLEKIPVLIASIAYSFSAFIGLQVTFINTAHSVLWLPLILFSIDKLLEKFKIGFFLLLIFSLFSSLNAGFFQGSLYIFIVAFFYATYMLWFSKKLYRYFMILSGFVFSVGLSAIQILPFMQVVSQSSRVAHYGSSALGSEIFEFFVKTHFFLTTFFPDFYGNPGKGNYFGETNSPAQTGYFEFNNFAGTVIILGFILGLSSLKKQKEVIFFEFGFILSLIFATANPVGMLPYQLSLPVISSLVPSRLLLVTQFSFLVIAAYGLDKFYKARIKIKQALIVMAPVVVFYLATLAVTFLKSRGLIKLFDIKWMVWDVSMRNVLIPNFVLLVSIFLLVLFAKLKKKIFFILIVIITSVELIRQTSFFRPFIKPELIFPKTEVTDFLEKNLQGNRSMIVNQDLIPTNSQLIYNLKIVDGEGPVYPKKYGDFMAAINFDKFKTELPQFRRMIYFRNTDASLLGALNIKYVVAMQNLYNPNLKLVFEKGSVMIYENTAVLPRAWSVNEVVGIDDPLQTMKTLVSGKFNPAETATVSNFDLSGMNLGAGKIGIEKFYQSGGNIYFRTKSDTAKLIVISEQFYPDWKLFIDGKEDKPISVDYNLLGVYLPAGEHEVSLKFEMELFKLGKIVSLVSLGLLLISVLLLKIYRLPKKI